MNKFRDIFLLFPSELYLDTTHLSLVNIIFILDLIFDIDTWEIITEISLFMKDFI
jgi:hypothetical protein